MDKAVYVVTKRDGKPVPDKDGPFELVVPGEKRAARWVRQATALRLSTHIARQRQNGEIPEGHCP
jgi:hypothetical protein